MKKILLLTSLAIFFSYSVVAQTWEARSGLSEKEFQNVFNNLTPKGYVPYEIDAINYYGEILFSGVWRQEEGVIWEARSGLSEKEYQNKFNTLTPQGYVPYSITVYKDANSNTKFAAIWKKEPHIAFIARHNLTEGKYQNQSNELAKIGYIPYSISVYEENNIIKFAVAWRKEPIVAYVTKHHLTEYEYQKTFDELTPKGFIPKEIASYKRNGTTNFAAVWIKQSGTWWEARHNMTSATFQKTFDKLNSKGYSPYIINAYLNNGNINYAVAWQYDRQQNRIPISILEKTFDTKKYKVNDSHNILSVLPVMQQTKVWCWLACGEMIFKHYGIPSHDNQGYQCGIIGIISGPQSPCYSKCFDCEYPSGSNYGTLKMISNYSMLAANKSFNFSESKQVSFEHIKLNIDNNKPLLCGTSTTRRQFYSDAEHVVLVVGYSMKDGSPYLVVNDPFPYPIGQNPYVQSGAKTLNKYQYEIKYKLFRDDIFWHWTISNIAFYSN